MSTQNSEKNNSDAALYVIYGEEDYLKKENCQRIIKKTVTAFPEFNLKRYDGVPDMDELASAVTNIPLMSERKCVVLRDAEPKAFNANEWKQMLSIIKNLPKECVLVFWYDAVKPSIKKDKRFASLVAQAKKEGQALELNAPTDTKMFNFISNIVKANGCEIDGPTASYLAEACGGEMLNIANETEKICNFAGGGKITKEQIDTMAIKPITTNIYDLAKAVVAGRLDSAMKILNGLFLEKEEPVVILSALSGAFCDIYRAKAALTSGEREQNVVSDFGYKFAFRVSNAMRDSRSCSLEFLEEALNLLMKADRDIKSTAQDKRTVLEQTIIKIDNAKKNQGGRKHGSYTH